MLWLTLPCARTHMQASSYWHVGGSSAPASPDAQITLGLEIHGFLWWAPAPLSSSAQGGKERIVSFLLFFSFMRWFYVLLSGCFAFLVSFVVLVSSFDEQMQFRRAEIQTGHSRRPSQCPVPPPVERAEAYVDGWESCRGQPGLFFKDVFFHIIILVFPTKLNRKKKWKGELRLEGIDSVWNPSICS